MDRPHIVIATPCFGGQVAHTFMLSVMRLQRHLEARGFGSDVLLLGGDSLISRARSVLVAHFLANPAATHLLFIDADIGFDVDQFTRLHEADRDFAAAFYPLKNTDWAQLPARAVAGEPLERAGLSYVGHLCTGAALQVEDGFATAEYAGTGFQLIHRRVFDRMVAAYPETKFRAVHASTNEQPPSDTLYALFDSLIDPATGTYLSEDYAFCRRWRALGGTIWLDLDSRLSHTGPATFVGDTGQRFARLRQPATVVGLAA
ncbi:hypothetical protein P7D22_16560 [Lichenihabitans sp. Uapishka_5]|uniref:hypothetical protein n=1 Tax=Lichenihabitans sp. Uapishka_5 TaxID=3037302 RepID=UPI0029E7D02F|nr:hypothetical protein [Lichenihabitans sp. Uapishka_5]MDX7952781.1 hypothetical protein [Lichenihabitans sp. Uapishka_5]